MIVNLGLRFDASIQAGLSHDHSTEFPFDQPRCPTAECRWNIVSTLGICAQTWNVTEHLNITYGDGDRSDVFQFAELPNGASANFSIPGQGRLITLNNGQEPLYQSLNASNLPKTPVFDFSIIYPVSPGLRAVETMFYFCIQRYNISVHNNTASRELVDITADADYDMFTMPNHPAKVNLTGLKVPDEPNTKFPYGGNGIEELQMSLLYALNGTYSPTFGPGTERGRAPSRYFTALEDVYQQGNGRDEDESHAAITNMTNNVARSLSNT